eukprot:c9736_g1_i2.p1 GENE.c9736_g1_i2~~c9736_g1_i2.p1  ORF type:complete len:571 (+),score=140.97 c9736_g1_i2:72-1784(+)
MLQWFSTWSSAPVAHRHSSNKSMTLSISESFEFEDPATSANTSLEALSDAIEMVLSLRRLTFEIRKNGQLKELACNGDCDVSRIVTIDLQTLKSMMCHESLWRINEWEMLMAVGNWCRWNNFENVREVITLINFWRLGSYQLEIARNILEQHSGRYFDEDSTIAQCTGCQYSGCSCQYSSPHSPISKADLECLLFLNSRMDLLAELSITIQSIQQSRTASATVAAPLAFSTPIRPFSTLSSGYSNRRACPTPNMIFWKHAHTNAICQLAALSPSKLVSVSSDKTVSVIQLPSQKMFRFVSGHDSGAIACHASFTSNMFATVGWDGYVLFRFSHSPFDIVQKIEIPCHDSKHKTAMPMRVVWDRDTVYIGCRDGSIHCISPSGVIASRQVHSDSVTCLVSVPIPTVSPVPPGSEEMVLISASLDGVVVAWSRNLRESCVIARYTKGITCLLHLFPNILLVSLAHGLVCVWEMQSGAIDSWIPTAQIQIACKSVIAGCSLGNGTKAVFCALDRTVSIWNIDSWSCEHRISQPFDFQSKSDQECRVTSACEIGGCLALGFSDGYVRLWQFENS